MVLTDFFDFLAPGDIRLKGHRIGIETVIFDYLDGLTPEEIVLRYPTLTLKDVYTTIAFYWQNLAEVDAYLRNAENHEARMRRAQDENPAPALVRLRNLSTAERASFVAEQSATPLA
jgi:uncharacterized protein (DUF433 family)